MKGLKSLYWFTHDLRIDDNPILHHACNSDQLLCVYCVDPRWFSAKRYHLAQMGALRWQFLQQNLEDLASQLAAYGQQLHIIHATAEQAIVQLCKHFQIDQLLVSRQFGLDERRSLASIEQSLLDTQLNTQLIEFDQSTLLPAAELEKGFPNLKGGFTPFKNRALMATDSIAMPYDKPTLLPPPVIGSTHDDKPLMAGFSLFEVSDSASSSDRQSGNSLDSSSANALPQYLPKPIDTQPLVSGGEFAAQQHMLDYFAEDYLLAYKHTRNELTGFHHSSKFSAWLNTGALSVRRVYDWVCQYEHQRGQNESTQWMIFELLWREYFHWLRLSQSASLFAFKGLRKKPPLTGYYGERFQKWCQGNTAYPLVNACMRELKSTGYLSNRGRQIVASCFVNELQLDWRYGAAWFEHQLLDYQVSVNWGNWQYIAGVGVDPRGGRHFNLQKQQQTYDPDLHYVRHWCGDEDFSQQAHDSVDAADWPIL